KGYQFDKYINLNKPGEVQVLLHFLDLVTALEYLHNFKLIHRDLKVNNIMIDNNLDTKLLDFGISRVSDNTSTNTKTIGTHRYMAPECFEFLTGETKELCPKSRISRK